MPVQSRKGSIRANGTHCQSPARAACRQRSEDLLWEQNLIDPAICNVEFTFGQCVLKVILNNTNNLYRYFHRNTRTVEVISARRNADMIIQTLRQCRREESFNSVYQKAANQFPFELRKARAPRKRPTQLTLESHHRTNTYYASIDKVLSELELRFSGNDQEILCFGKYLSQWNTR